MEDDYLVIPNPLRDLAPVRYNLQLVAEAESRVQDIRIANPATGQDLLALFSRACFQLSKVYADLTLQLALANDRLNKRKAVLLIDIIPDLIKAKGLQDNQMSRNAFLDRDQEYSDVALVIANIEAATMLVKGKLKAMEDALRAVKSIYDATSSAYKRPNPNLATTGINSAPDMKPPQDVITRYDIEESHPTTIGGLKLGKARYGKDE